MAFKTNIPLQAAFTTLINQAAQTKSFMTQWSANLAGNITALQAIQIADHCRAVLAAFNTAASVPGLGEYAKAQYSDANYDIVASYTAMVSSINGVLSWLNTNLPAGSVSVVSGSASLTSTSYTPAQTAGLLAKVNLVIAAIE